MFLYMYIRIVTFTLTNMRFIYKHVLERILKIKYQVSYELYLSFYKTRPFGAYDQRIKYLVSCTL